MTGPKTSDVWVVTCKPRNGNCEYTYGVFTHDEYALAHLQVHGDKDSDFITKRESLMASTREDLSKIEKELGALKP